MEMGLILMLALVPVGVFGGVSAAPTPSPLTYELASDGDQDMNILDLKDLTPEMKEYLNLNISKCNDLNNPKSKGDMYVNTMEYEDDTTEARRQRLTKGKYDNIEGPRGKGLLVKNHTLENKFHLPSCLANPTLCKDGFTVAVWYSVLANDTKWAATWPGNGTCTLVSINDHIVITSRTGRTSESDAAFLNEIQIDLNPAASNNKIAYSLNNTWSHLMGSCLLVCKNQTEGANCTGKDKEQTHVGWQWNHFAVVAKRTTVGYKLRLFWNGNAVPADNITETDSITPKGAKGILLNMFDDDSTCDDVGFDNFGIWSKSLTHDEILQLYAGEFCNATSTKPPKRKISELLGKTGKTEPLTNDQRQNATFVENEVLKKTDNIEKLTEAAQEVDPAELKEYVKDTLDVLKSLATSEDVFPTDDPVVTKKLAEILVGAFSGILGLAEVADLTEGDKQDLAVDAVNACSGLAQNLLKTGQENIAVNTPDNSNIKIEFQKKITKETGSVEMSGVNIPYSAYEDGAATIIAVVTIKYESAKLLPVKIAKSENQEEVQLVGPVKVIETNGGEGTKYSPPLVIKNDINPSDDPKKTVPNCVYMTKDNEWATDGVVTVIVKIEADGNMQVECHCEHLTNFAVLMSASPIKISAAHTQALSTLTTVCISISLVALFISIVILFVFRELHGTRISILKHLSIAMFIAQLMFITAVERATFNPKLCLVIAVFTHYLWLAVFFWMLAQGIFLYMKLRLAVRSDANIVWFCLIGWGFPAVMVTVTAGINIDAYGRKDLCWLSFDSGGVWAFLGPVLAICLINCVVIVMAMKAFTSVKSYKDKDDKEKFKSTLKAMVVMLPLLGLTWFFGIFANIPGTGGLAFMYIFSICSGLQGFFLFLFHIVFNAEVQKVIKRNILKRSGSVGSEEPSFIRKMMGPDSGVTQTSDFGKSSKM